MEIIHHTAGFIMHGVKGQKLFSVITEGNQMQTLDTVLAISTSPKHKLQIFKQKNHTVSNDIHFVLHKQWMLNCFGPDVSVLICNEGLH